MRNTLILSSIFLSLQLSCGSKSESNKSSDGAKTQSGSTDPSSSSGTGAGSWYKPALNVSWQWQLTGSLNTGYDVELYDIDLFDSSVQTIAGLKAKGKKVICYFSAGSSEDWRPDYATIEDASKGSNLDNWPGEKWLDIRTPNVLNVFKARLDLAVSKGCDGVEPDNVDAYNNSSGFPLTAADQLKFNKTMADEAHKRGLSIALKNDLDQVLELEPYFDFSVNEQCQEYDECEMLMPFIKAGKPVLNAEYQKAKSAALCKYGSELLMRTLVLPLDLDDSFRISCF
jgi:hypothetical protein